MPEDENPGRTGSRMTLGSSLKTANADAAASRDREREKETGAPLWRVLLEPTIVIILLAEVAHIARHNVTDIAVFGCTPALIVVDRVRALPTSRRPVTRWFKVATRPSTVAALCTAYGLAVMPLSRGGRILPVILAVPGVIALYWLWRSRPSTRDPVPLPTPSSRWAAWPTVLLAGCLFELANFLSQPDANTPSPAHPVLSDLVEPMLSTGVARGLVCAAWLAVGFWLLRTISATNEKSW
jgi:hypothetical protein